MIDTILFLAIMAFLFKFSPINKWWLWFALISGLALKCGFSFGPIGLIVGIGAWKVIKDVFQVDKRN
jgi:hypothetical protein